jgi:hypothetical protein
VATATAASTLNDELNMNSLPFTFVLYSACRMG